MIKNKVKYYRKKFALSQTRLAELVNISRQSISSIERNESVPSLETAFKLSRELYVAIHILFQYEE